MANYDRKQISKEKYISLVDFSNKIDQLVNVKDKLKLATNYLITYGILGETDYSLPQAIHFVRAKLSESLGEYLDKPTQFFLADPVRYLKGYALVEASKARENTSAYEDPLMEEHFLNIAEELNNDVSNQVATLDRNKNSIDLSVRMAVRLGSKKEYEKVLKNTKPGFFSRLFNTSSIYAKHLDKTFNDFNKPSSNIYGNLNAIEDAASQYLHYKFPNWNLGDELPNLTPEQLNLFDKTSKARILFSISAIDAARSQRKIENSFVGMANINSVRDISFEKMYNEEQINRAKFEYEKNKFVAEAKQQDEVNSLKENEEMNLEDESFIIPPKEEKQILDDLNPINIDTYDSPAEKEIIENADKLGESQLDHDNIVKAKAEEERIKNYKYNISFASELQEDTQIDIDVAKQVEEYNNDILRQRKEELAEEEKNNNNETSGLDSAEFTENQVSQ